MAEAAASLTKLLRRGLALIVDGSTRAGPIAAIPQVLLSLGIDPDEVAAEVGIEVSLFADSDNTISFAVMGPLFRQSRSRLVPTFRDRSATVAGNAHAHGGHRGGARLCRGWLFHARLPAVVGANTHRLAGCASARLIPTALESSRSAAVGVLDLIEGHRAQCRPEANRSPEACCGGRCHQAG